MCQNCYEIGQKDPKWTFFRHFTHFFCVTKIKMCTLEVLVYKEKTTKTHFTHFYFTFARYSIEIIN